MWIWCKFDACGGFAYRSGCMREIKVRVWDKRRKRWIDVAELVVKGDGSISKVIERGTDEHYRLDQIELVEAIGHKDKKRRDIYDGDILKWHRTVGSKARKKEEMGLVEWMGNSFLVTAQVNEDLWRFTYPPQSLSRPEIIGNRYENPELLEIVGRLTVVRASLSELVRTGVCASVEG